MALSNAMRRLNRRYSNAVNTATRFAVRLGTVTTVTAGAAADGNAAVSVSVRGSVTPAPYLASYTPAVNDQVHVLLVDDSPLILGRVVGLPNF